MGASNKPTNKRVLLIVPKNIPTLFDDMLEALSYVDITTVSDDLEAIRAALPGHTAMIACPRHLFSEDLLANEGRDLEWMHNPGAGVEQFIFPEFIASDITFTNGRIIQGPECADHALALLLSLTRNLYLTMKGDVQGMPRPIELRGKTAVVIGAGGIGTLVAERAAAFGMKIIAVNPDYVPMVSFIDRVVQPEHMTDVLPEADVVFMTSAFSPIIGTILGEREFSAFKQGAYFVNVSRGRTVSTDALHQALESGRIGAAGLDVTDPEPLGDDHPLRSMKNVVLTPHIAGLSDFNRDRSKQLIKENIERYVGDRPLMNIVNKDLGY